MIVIGIVLVIAGYLLPLPLFTTVGVILVVVGAVFAVLGGTGRAVAGRRHFW